MTANQVNGHPKPLAMPVYGEWQPVTPPQLDAQAETDRAEAAALLAKANELHTQAGKEADRVRNAARAELDRARAEAQRIRDDAAAETDQKKKRAGELDVWAARVVIAGAVGLTASGEYALALMVGFSPWSAWLLPVVIDVYVIQAFRRHRDILQAIGLTIAANVIYHLAEVGLFGLTPSGKPQWWLIAVVASIASLILWRMHLMIAPPRERRTRRKVAVTPHVDAPPVAPVPAPVSDVPAAKSETAPVASSPTEAPVSVASSASPTGDSSAARKATTGAASGAGTGAKKAAGTAAKKTPPGRQKAPRPVAKKTPARRSLDEWVEVASPVFHAEFARLRRNPTANEFATAIKAARLGDVSDSTAKNIRAEILDRTELPVLD